MPGNLHSHEYRGNTTYNDGHVHMYYGSTSQVPDTPNHMHIMMGETSYNDGHTHRYSLYTSPSIKVGNGHTHYYQAGTSFNDNHLHYLYGYNTVYS